MRTDRLLKLADFLETVPRKAFNIGAWEQSKVNKPEGKIPGECGFAGCAVGWAVHAKLFRGLKFIPNPYGWDENDITPSYAGQEGFEAAEKLFDISGIEAGDGWDASRHLFSPGTYKNDPTPKQVAKRICKFVRDHATA